MGKKTNKYRKEQRKNSKNNQKPYASKNDNSSEKVSLNHSANVHSEVNETNEKENITNKSNQDKNITQDTSKENGENSMSLKSRIKSLLGKKDERGIDMNSNEDNINAESEKVVYSLRSNEGNESVMAEENNTASETVSQEETKAAVDNIKTEDDDVKAEEEKFIEHSSSNVENTSKELNEYSEQAMKEVAVEAVKDINEKEIITKTEESHITAIEDERYSIKAVREAIDNVHELTAQMFSNINSSYNRIVSNTESSKKNVNQLREELKHELNEHIESIKKVDADIENVFVVLREDGRINKNNIIRAVEVNENKIIEQIKKSDVSRVAENRTILNQMESNKKSAVDIKDIKKEIGSLNEDLDYKINNIDKKIKEMVTTTQLLEGKLKLLDEIKEIKEMVKEGHKTIKEEIPPSSLDEDLIVRMSMYGKQIFDELTVAARHYAINKKSIDELQEEKRNYEKRILEAREKAEEEGIKKGKLDIINELADKFENLDNLYNSESSEAQIIVSILKNYGLNKHHKLIQDAEVEITELNRIEMEAYASFQGVGNFKVVRSAFIINDKVYKKAQLELL